MILQKRCTIKIPNNFSVLYCSRTNLLFFENGGTSRILVLKTKILVLPQSNCIVISDNMLEKKKGFTSKKGKASQRLVAAQIKLILFQISSTFYKKLSLVGVGYKAFESEVFKSQLTLNLGFSHSIYIRIPASIKVCCVKATDIFIYGNCSLHAINQFASYIRNFKVPEPYKGKGIRYNHEKIKLKKGKKI